MRTPKLPKPWKPIKRKVYKPMGFGEGLQLGTVEAELNQRRLRKERRRAGLRHHKSMTTAQLITAITIPSALIIVSIVNDQVHFHRVIRRPDGMILRLERMILRPR